MDENQQQQLEILNRQVKELTGPCHQTAVISLSANIFAF